MERYAVGDDSAFGPLYDALSGPLYAFLTRQARSRETAKDLLQQTFLQIHVNRGGFIPGKSATTYAFAIARRLWIDLERRARTRAERPLPDDDTEGVALAWLAESGIEAALDARASLLVVEGEVRRWSSEQRQMFDLVHADGLSHAEVAGIFGTTTNAIKQRVNRLKRRLVALVLAATGDPP